MSKKQLIIMIFVLPNLRAAANLLRAQDADSTGPDDVAANAIDFAVGELERWINNVSPLTQIPTSQALIDEGLKGRNFS